MDVSGRRRTDMLGSLVSGSAEDFNITCEPCLTIGQHIEAHGFCVQCQEYLCKTCLDCHRRTKCSRSHQTFGRDEFYKVQITRNSSKECTEQCPLHQKEIIKFYCPKHAYLGCNDCMTIGHRACEIDYIPEKCVDIADGKEYNEITMKLCKKLKKAEEVSRRAEGISSETDDINKEVIRKIAEFRAEINDRLDRMQQDILNNVEGKTSNNKKIVQKAIDTCREIISDLKKLQCSLRANKSNNQIGQLFIEMKRALSAVNSNILNQVKEKLINTNVQYLFSRSTDLENLLLNEIVFRDLISHPRPVSAKKYKMIYPLLLENDINVNTKSDKYKCDIRGCAVLPPNKIVLAYYNNSKVKVVTVENELVQQEKTLDAEPWDIAVMSENQFAVTMPNAQRIDIMTTDDKLALICSIQVNENCYGIGFHEGRLYVACLNPSCIFMLSNTPLEFLSSYNSPYIAVSKDSNLLYISDSYNNSVVSVSLHGDVLSIYQHENFLGLKGMCLLENGSLVVCCNSNATIHQISDGLKGGTMRNNDIAYPRSICYRAHNNKFYVGCGDNLKVLR